MRNIIEGGLIVLAAFILTSALQQISVALTVSVNIFAAAVIVFALNRGELAGAVLGMICGLIVDSFSLGIFGLAGIANTVTGFAAGVISRKINVLPLGRTFVFIGLMGLLDVALWMLLTSVFFAEGLAWGGGLVLVQPLGTAVLGTLVVWLSRRIKVRHER
jgi:rod shape-determining protein MreD